MKRLLQLFLLILTLACWSESAWAAIARVSSSTGGTDGTSVASFNLAAFNAVSGNSVVLCVRDGGITAPSSITDTAMNTYTLKATQASGIGSRPGMWAYVAENISANATNVIAVTFAASATYRWGFAIQYSGTLTSSATDVAAGTDGTGVTDLVSASITTAQASEVLVMCGAQSALNTYTAGMDFTLINGSIGAEGQNFGGAEEYITSGTLSSYTAHMTASGSQDYTVIYVSLKAAAAAATHKNCILLSVC